MAIVISRVQPVEVVHRSDPAATLPGVESADPGWLLAAGQPEACTRLKARALTLDEYATVADIEGLARHLEAVHFGLVEVDGQPPPGAAEMPAGWVLEIGNLIFALTHGPFAGRPSKSAAAPSPAVNDGGELHGS